MLGWPPTSYLRWPKLGSYVTYTAGLGMDSMPTARLVKPRAQAWDCPQVRWMKPTCFGEKWKSSGRRTEAVCAISSQWPLFPASTDGTRWCTDHGPAPRGDCECSPEGFCPFGGDTVNGEGRQPRDSSLPGVRAFKPQLLREGDHCSPPLQTRPLMQEEMQGLEGQKGRKPKFIGPQEVPVPRPVSTFNFHQPLLVSVWRNMDTTAVAGWSRWGGDGSAQDLDLALRRLWGWELWCPLGRCPAGGCWEGKAPHTGRWDVAVRSIIACCTDYTTQTISDILSLLKTSPENLHELETWQYAGLDMAKPVRWGHCAVAQHPPLPQTLHSRDFQPQQTLSSPFALWVMSDLYSSPTCITFVYFCNILKYSNIPYLGGSLEGG